MLTAENKLKNLKTKKGKIVLAFSGGLDTSFCVIYLKELGFDVVTVTVDTGGFTAADIKKIGDQAKKLGVYKHFFINGKNDLFDKFVSYIIKGNILRGGVYPLCAGTERLVIGQKIVEVAKKIGANNLAHGSTGAGNDQVRFDVALAVLAPKMKVETPIRDLGISREDEVLYLKKHKVTISTETKKYSINVGMLGTTVGGNETKGSWEIPPEGVIPNFKTLETASKTPQKIIISFEKGLPVAIDGKKMSGAEIMEHLNVIGAKHAVGKNIHLGNTIIGIKGRILFAAPAALILIRAHSELEKLVLAKWQSFWKGNLAEFYGSMLHEALYFDPAMRDIEAYLDSSQKVVYGDVRISLYKGNIVVEGVKSPFSLMDTKIAIYGEENPLWDAKDIVGFSKIYGLSSVVAANVQKGINEKN